MLTARTAVARRFLPSLGRCFSSHHETVALTVDGYKVKVNKGATVLDACKEARAQVPTLCYHPMLRPVGVCRLCLVESKQPWGTKLIASCATEATSGMDIITQSANIDSAVKVNLGFLRCRHPNKCMTCEVNGRCQFQDLVYKYQVEDDLPAYMDAAKVGGAADPSECVKANKSAEAARELRSATEVSSFDRSSNALNRDMEKCVVCTRCIRACSDVQGLNVYGMTQRGFDERVITAGDLPISQTGCISCGQCTAVCPVGALTEKPHIHNVQNILHTRKLHKKVLVVTTAPAVRVALGEEFSMESGGISTGKMVAALRELGFDFVFDTNFSADVTIAEEAFEFVKRLQAGGPFPMFTSCCPGWVNLMEKHYPELFPLFSTCKSPQGMIGALVKSYFAQKIGRTPDEIVHVSIMPCVAKKDEAARPQLTVDVNGKKVPETDYVLTTRELAHLIKSENIPFASLKERDFDTLMGDSTGAAALFGVTGGVMEAALRGAYEYYTKKELKNVDFKAVRGLDGKHGGIREATVNVEGAGIKVAVAHGSKNIRQICDEFKAGKKYQDFHLIEIMACPGGCIGGGGQSKSLDPQVLQKRSNAIYEIDAQKSVRRSLHNPMLIELYRSYLGEPNGHKSHELLHTTYTDRTSEVKMSEKAPFGNIPTAPRAGTI